jgi:hypothetical protein
MYYHPVMELHQCYRFSEWTNPSIVRSYCLLIHLESILKANKLLDASRKYNGFRRNLLILHIRTGLEI